MIKEQIFFGIKVKIIYICNVNFTELFYSYKKNYPFKLKNNG